MALRACNDATMPGVRITEGADFQISNIRISIDGDGNVIPHPITTKLRTDMWPAWLFEAIEAAEDCQKYAALIPDAVKAGDDGEITRLLMCELRAAMRAITAAVFSIDALYTSVKVRSPEHPDQERWKDESASRSTQVVGTFRHHLQLKNDQVQRLSKRIKMLFKFRGWAVHPGSQFRAPVYRADVDAGVDWHHVAFRCANAVNSVAIAVEMVDFLISRMDQGSDDLKSLRLVRDALWTEYSIATS